MDCREAEELIAPYLLGALDSPERHRMEAHLEDCDPCSLKLQGDCEAVARLAFGVPRQEVPAGVKERLFARLEGPASPSVLSRVGGRLAEFWIDLGGAAVPHIGKAAAGVLVLGMVFGGLWFNHRLTQVSRDSDALRAEMQASARRENDIVDMVEKQHYLTYEAVRVSNTPGASVNMLWSTQEPSRARGMLMLSDSGTQALLFVIGLTTLPDDKEYQVWLIKGGQRFSGGLFRVDSTGFGQAAIIAVGPFTDFEAIGITVEPAGGSEGPTGESVLKGGL